MAEEFPDPGLQKTRDIDPEKSKVESEDPPSLSSETKSESSSDQAACPEGESESTSRTSDSPPAGEVQLEHTTTEASKEKTPATEVKPECASIASSKLKSSIPEGQGASAKWSSPPKGQGPTRMSDSPKESPMETSPDRQESRSATASIGVGKKVLIGAKKLMLRPYDTIKPLFSKKSPKKEEQASLTSDDAVASTSGTKSAPKEKSTEPSQQQQEPRPPLHADVTGQQGGFMHGILSTEVPEGYDDEQTQLTTLSDSVSNDDDTDRRGSIFSDLSSSNWPESTVDVSGVEKVSEASESAEDQPKGQKRVQDMPEMPEVGLSPTKQRDVDSESSSEEKD